MMMVYFYRQKFVSQKKGMIWSWSVVLWTLKLLEKVWTRCRIRKSVCNCQKNDKKQEKKYVRQICFVLTLQEFNRYYYRLPEMESFSLIYSHMIVSYSGYPESSVSNQSSVMETSNTKKKNHQRKFAVPLRTLLGKNYSKKFKQIIAHFVRF